MNDSDRDGAQGLSEDAEDVLKYSPEAKMLSRFAAGDESALDELVVQYQDPAFWVARHILGHDDLAQDIVQDAFIKLLRKAALYDPQRPFKAWFLQIVRNLSIDYLRKKRPNTFHVLAEMSEVSGDTANIDEFIHQELQLRIQLILQEVPEKYRELIVLRDIEGYGEDEISVITETDYGTTRWRIHNARKLFKKAWVKRFGHAQYGT